MNRLVSTFAPRAIVAVAVFALALPAGAAEAVVRKVIIADGTYREISNTGTLNAVNRIFESDRMPLSAKTQAIAEILTGAYLAGSLVPASLVAGDTFFALDSKTNEVIVVTFTTTEFRLPSGSTEFSRFSVPPS